MWSVGDLNNSEAGFLGDPRGGKAGDDVLAERGEGGSGGSSMVLF